MKHRQTMSLIQFMTSLMTSHATLTYKRSLHFTALCCSFDTTHSDCSHCITPQACARAPHTLLSHPGSLCTDSPIHTEGKAMLSHLSQDTKQAFTPTAQLLTHPGAHLNSNDSYPMHTDTSPQATASHPSARAVRTKHHSNRERLPEAAHRIAL